VINHWAGTNWTIDFDGEKLAINGSGRTQVIHPSADSPITIKRFWFSKYLIHQGSKIILVPGISKINPFSLTFAQEIHLALNWLQRFT